MALSQLAYPVNIQSCVYPHKSWCDSIVYIKERFLKNYQVKSLHFPTCDRKFCCQGLIRIEVVPTVCVALGILFQPATTQDTSPRSYFCFGLLEIVLLINLAQYSGSSLDEIESSPACVSTFNPCDLRYEHQDNQDCGKLRL